MHERLFENYRNLVPLEPHAEALGLDLGAFQDCMSSDRHAPAIRQDMQIARSNGITGTPGFVLARTDPGDPKKVTGVKFLRGAQPFAVFKSAIDAALSE
jgi:predicted DsbA family dithiol-disulfide isomerase